MTVDRRFPRQVALTLLIIGGVAGVVLYAFGTGDMLIAAAVGAVLSTLNALAGFLAIEYAFDKSYTTFLKAVLGGMGVRMLVMLGALLALILLLRMHAVALTLSMLGFYLVYLILEISFIQRKMLTKGQRN